LWYISGSVLEKTASLFPISGGGFWNCRNYKNVKVCRKECPNTGLSTTRVACFKKQNRWTSKNSQKSFTCEEIETEPICRKDDLEKHFNYNLKPSF